MTTPATTAVSAPVHSVSASVDPVSIYVDKTSGKNKAVGLKRKKSGKNKAVGKKRKTSGKNKAVGLKRKKSCSGCAALTNNGHKATFDVTVNNTTTTYKGCCTCMEIGHDGEVRKCSVDAPSDSEDFNVCPQPFERQSRRLPTSAGNLYEWSLRNPIENTELAKLMKPYDWRRRY